jgi:SAM-dependent methyltransferase
VCHSTPNSLIASEISERRFGKPVMPEGVYDFARCRDCGTLYVDSDVDEQYLASIYEHETIDTAQDGKAEAEAEAAVREARLPEFRAHWDLMKRHRRPRLGDRLLDMGCQMGDFGALAQADGVEPYGIELSEDYAARCRRRWGGSDRVHRGLLSMARYPDSHFQYITAFETLEHILDPIEALGAFHRWLADDGLVAFSVPSSDYFHFKFWLMRASPVAGIVRRMLMKQRAFYATQVLPHTHIYNFSVRSAGQMLKKAGFRPVHIGLTGWHGPVGRAVDPIARALNALTGGKVSVAPSLIAIGRKL